MKTQSLEKLLESAAAYRHNEHMKSDRKTDPGQTALCLNDSMERELVRQIGLLPEDAKQAFFGKYCFRIKDEDMDDALGRKGLRGLTSYYEPVLCGLLGLEEGMRIDEASMKKCCDAALSIYTDQIIADAGRADKAPPAENKQTTAGRGKWKRVFGAAAAAAAVLLACFSFTLTVNADFRAKVLKWFIEDRTEYSVFRTEPEEGEVADVTIKDLWRYEPTYIPERFTFAFKDSISDLVSYGYLDPDDYYLHILMQLPGNDIMIDTEDMEMEELTWNGQEAYLYSSETKGISFSFTLDGFPVYIGGKIDREECFEIAKGIRRR